MKKYSYSVFLITILSGLINLLSAQSVKSIKTEYDTGLGVSSCILSDKREIAFDRLMPLFSFEINDSLINSLSFNSEEIGDWAVIGMGAVVSIGSKIGAGSIVAEGAIIKMNQIIPEKVVAAGNPAKIIRAIEEKDIELWSRGKQLYVDLAKKYLEIGMQKVSE